MNGWFLRLALIVALPAVRPIPPQAGDLRAGLLEAQEKWQARKPPSYEFTLEVRCFCWGILKTPPSFRVVSGDPSPVGDLEGQPQEFYKSFNTVEKLFAAIDRSLASGHQKSTVQYDGELGFPLVADLDPSQVEDDDELYLRVTSFRVMKK